jgi:hypothetical protein
MRCISSAAKTGFLPRPIRHDSSPILTPNQNLSIAFEKRQNKLDLHHKEKGDFLWIEEAAFL